MLANTLCSMRRYISNSTNYHQILLEYYVQPSFHPGFAKFIKNLLLQSNFALSYFDWMIVSKNLILKTGREYASEIHPVVTTFSAVVSSEMAPGFHIIIYTATNDDYLLTDSAYFPVQAINRHKIEFSLNQIKDHLMNTVEATCRGDPGAVFLSSTVRSAIYATQVLDFRTILKSFF